MFKGICTGTCVEPWKLDYAESCGGAITFIYANFRSISNLIFISKLTEKVVASQLVDYVMRNDLDEIFQSAYKQLHSTETALVRVRMTFLLL